MTEQSNILQSIKTFLPQIISFVFGFCSAIFAEPIKDWIFKPELKLDFNNDGDHVALTPEGDGMTPIHLMRKAYYIRISVTNTKRIEAKNCRAYLINIERSSQDGEYAPTSYCERILLAWSCQNEGEQYLGLAINYGAVQFADIITTRENHKRFWPQIKLTPFRYEPIFEESGKFRFTIQVTASNANPKIIKLIFEWNKVWDNFKVNKG